MKDPLRGSYDFPLTNLAADRGSRGRVFRAIPRGSRVLDIGCDTGRMGEALRQQLGCEVYGIEADPVAAAEARPRLDHIDVRKIESARDLADQSGFDVVLFLDVLEHLYDPWSVLIGAREALRAGGVVISVVPNIAHFSVIRRLLQGRFEYEEHGRMDRTHVRWFTRRSFASAFHDAGLVEVRVDVLPVVPWLQEIPRVGDAIADRLGRWLPDQFGGSLIGTAHRP
jgi:2-polyprenyl-3-methyl-5-hydroxy-6-metoxy-1,4-benzoquinol methylase